MFNGDAAGFKICTLLRLQEVKSKSPCKTLLHHLVQMVNEGDQKLLGFVNEILPLEKAARYLFVPKFCGAIKLIYFPRLSLVFLIIILSLQVVKKI